MNKNTKPLIGKTIKSVSKKAVNMWTMRFTDGSKVEIWAETDGPINIPQVWLDNFTEKNS